MKPIELRITEKVTKKQLGALLRAVRKQHGRTQQHVGSKCDLLPTAVARLESGVMEPRVLTMARYCAALGRRLVLVVK